MRAPGLLLAALAFTWSAPLLAGPSEDLTAGRQALEKGDLDRAQSLLASAAQGLPRSVEAQLALADCHLQLGHLGDALGGYRAVLVLSPRHPRATRLVASLTGQKTTHAEQLASAQALIELGAHTSAEKILTTQLDQPLAPDQRSAVRLLLAEVHLWSGSTADALREALGLARDPQAEDRAGPAQVLAALALLGDPRVPTSALRDLLARAGRLTPPWSARADLVSLALQSHDPVQAATVSAKLAPALDSIPIGAFRQGLVTSITRTLLHSAETAAGAGDATQTIAILWPMISGTKIPDAGALLKSTPIKGGWTMAPDPAAQTTLHISQLLARSGEVARTRHGTSSLLLGYWLSAELLRQSPQVTPVDRAARLLDLATRAEQAGKLAFDLQASTLAHDANSKLTPPDALALTLLAQASATDPSAPAKAQPILERYVAASRWSAAIEGVQILSSGAGPNAARLAVLQMKIRQVISTEEDLRTAHRPLTAQLPDQLKESLTALVPLLKDPSKPGQDALTLATSLVDRYAKMDRHDLAEAVITACQPGVPEWAIWTRARLLGQRGDQALATGSGKQPDPLEPHRLELAQITELVSKHPQSAYIAPAVARVEALAQAYQAHRAHATAEKILADFTRAHPTLATVERMELQRARIAMDRADLILPRLAGPNKPAQLSPEHQAAIDALETFLKTHATGSLAAAAQKELFKIALDHGRVGAWALARQVIDRYQKAVPTAHSPAQAQLMQTATYLGELDIPRGLDLLASLGGQTPPRAFPQAMRPTPPADQDQAIKQAYPLLLERIKAPAEADASRLARDHLLWMIDYLEKQARPDQAHALIERFLTDQPGQPDRLALGLRSVANQLRWAARSELEASQPRFDQARDAARKLIAQHAANPEMARQAHLLIADAYEQESGQMAARDPVRAGGLLMHAVGTLLTLARVAASHPEAPRYLERVAQHADQLIALGQNDQAIQVLTDLSARFPLSPLARKALLRSAELYTTNLANPLDAVGIYQTYLSRYGDDQGARTQIYTIASQLAAQNRYLEAHHIYQVFVETFPTDPRVVAALRALGQLHQTNESWTQAIRYYQRIVDEFPQDSQAPQVEQAIAQCQISLGAWQTARQVYEQYLRSNPQGLDVSVVRGWIDVLKQIERYEQVLAGKDDNPNKPDAQLQIGRLVLEKLDNPTQAVVELRKVADSYPQSELADDAMLEAGRALLSLGRPGEARAILLRIPEKYPGSPLADDALFLVGESHEREARKLADNTTERVRAESQIAGQREAFQKLMARAEQAEKKSALPGTDETEAVVLAAALRGSMVSSVSIDQLYCQVCEAEARAEAESVLRVANRQDRINEAYRQAVGMYGRAATEYPLGDSTDGSLSRMASVLENELKDQAAAVQTYQKIVKLFPGTPSGEDAAWKLAQFYVARRSHVEAVAAYRDFIRNYPASARIADAQFGLAEVLERQGQWVDAMDAYETFRQKFGQHPRAKQALDQITWIKTYRRK